MNGCAVGRPLLWTDQQVTKAQLEAKTRVRGLEEKLRVEKGVQGWQTRGKTG